MTICLKNRVLHFMGWTYDWVYDGPRFRSTGRQMGHMGHRIGRSKSYDECQQVDGSYNRGSYLSVSVFDKAACFIYIPQLLHKARWVSNFAHPIKGPTRFQIRVLSVMVAIGVCQAGPTVFGPLAQCHTCTYNLTRFEVSALVRNIE